MCIYVAIKSNAMVSGWNYWLVWRTIKNNYNTSNYGIVNYKSHIKSAIADLSSYDIITGYNL